MSDIKNIKKLSDDEFRRLFNNYKKEGDMKAFNRIIEANLLYAVKFAARYSGYNTPYADLIEVCNEALICALKKYDINSGNFLSYANYFMMAKLRFTTYRDWQVKPNCKAMKTMKEGTPMNEVLSIESMDADNTDDHVSYVAVSHDESMEPDYSFRGEEIELMLNTLKERERYVVASKHGLLGMKEKSIYELSREFGLTHQAVYDIYNKALKKLKNKIIEK